MEEHGGKRVTHPTKLLTNCNIPDYFMYNYCIMKGICSRRQCAHVSKADAHDALNCSTLLAVTPLFLSQSLHLVLMTAFEQCERKKYIWRRQQPINENNDWILEGRCM